MARPAPPVVPFHQLTPGQLADCFVLLAEKARSLTRDGQPYYTCRFCDMRRSVLMRIWADAPYFEMCDKEWIKGQFYKLRGAYSQHDKYGPQFELLQIRLAHESDRKDGFDPAALVECSRFPADEMLVELKAIVEQHIVDEPLRRLVLTLVDRHAEPLQRRPATVGKFFPFAGGLLEHILSVTKSCLLLIDRYAPYYKELVPPLNKDLVIAAAVLHDMGRVVELGDEPQGAEQTVPGRMFGHLMLGRDLVRDAAREQGDVDPDLLQMLEHIVVSHLVLPEWGSPRLPLVPECLILHHADDLDAKLEMYVRCLSKDESPGPFTDRDPVLHRPLYKGRRV